MSTGRSRAVAVARALGAVAIAGFALSPLLPLLARHWSALGPLERAARFWFELHCERDPARTLSFGGALLGVCARCSGIYFGIGLGALWRWPELSARATRLWVGLGAALMWIDVSLEDHGIHGGLPWLRVLTGLLLAYPVGVGLGAWVARAPAAAHKP